MAAVVDRGVRRRTIVFRLTSGSSGSASYSVSGATSACDCVAAPPPPPPPPPRDPVIVAGAGIGGLAAARWRSAQRGFRVVVLEQAAEIGEIGAGVQLAPNAFAAFDALGVGERARGRAVYT